jgi:DHA1 family bicyclomycin/chloramphenicol resistance-like MFS transporter
VTTILPTHRADVAERTGSVPTRLLLVCAFMASTSPLAIDLYLASFPDIARDLGTTAGRVQLTLTAYLIGISVGQPIWGPLSDRLGRRTTLLVSSSITVASSLAVLLAPTIGLLVGARFVQALSAAAGMVVARAMISDLTEGYAGVRALATMMTIQGLVPVAAPALGGLLATFLPWRGVLGVLLGILGVQLVVTVLTVPETLPPVLRAPRLDYRDLARVVARPAYLTYAVTLGLVVGSVMTYVASASFVYQDVLGFPPLLFGLSFTLNALGMVAAGLVSARRAGRQHHPARTAGLALPAAAACCLLVVALAASPWPVLVVVPILGNAFFANLVMGNCMGLAMQQARGLPGAGSAMLGLFMFGISALVTPVVGLLGGVGSAVPMGLVMSGATLLAAGVFAVGRRWIARHPAIEAAFC